MVYTLNNKLLLAHLTILGANLIYDNYGFAKDVMNYVPPFTFILKRN